MSAGLTAGSPPEDGLHTPKGGEPGLSFVERTRKKYAPPVGAWGGGSPGPCGGGGAKTQG
jgi:hypothetical protein